LHVLFLLVNKCCVIAQVCCKTDAPAVIKVQVAQTPQQMRSCYSTEAELRHSASLCAQAAWQLQHIQQ